MVHTRAQARTISEHEENAVGESLRRKVEDRMMEVMVQHHAASMTSDNYGVMIRAVAESRKMPYEFFPAVKKVRQMVERRAREDYTYARLTAAAFAGIRVTLDLRRTWYECEWNSLYTAVTLVIEAPAESWRPRQPITLGITYNVIVDPTNDQLDRVYKDHDDEFRNGDETDTEPDDWEDDDSDVEDWDDEEDEEEEFEDVEDEDGEDENGGEVDGGNVDRGNADGGDADGGNGGGRDHEWDVLFENNEDLGDVELGWIEIVDPRPGMGAAQLAVPVGQDEEAEMEDIEDVDVDDEMEDVEDEADDEDSGDDEDEQSDAEAENQPAENVVHYAVMYEMNELVLDYDDSDDDMEA